MGALNFLPNSLGGNHVLLRGSYPIVTGCQAHVADNHDYIVGIVQGVDQVKLDLADCVHQESSKLATKKKACLLSADCSGCKEFWSGQARAQSLVFGH